MADKLVEQLLVSQNRPFNVQLVADLLATKGVKKPTAQRSLDTLATDGKIRVKEFGKAKIYYPNRDGNVLPAEEMAALQQNLASVQQQCADVKETAAVRRRELHQLRAAVSLKELQERKSKLQTEIARLESDLAPLRSGKQTVSEEAYRAAEKVTAGYLAAWQRRKRIFYDIWGDMADGMSQKECQVFEEAGIDTDEAMKLSLKEFNQLVGNKRAR